MLAIALSIAINEVIIGLVRAPHPAPERPTRTPVMLRFERRPTPPPTAPPTPPPVVRVPPHVTPAPVPQVAAAKAAGPVAKAHSGAPAKPTHHFDFDVYKQLAKNKLGRAEGVVGTGTGTGAGDAVTGAGDPGTQGTGAGTDGTGSGAVNANTPCGTVTFIPRGAPAYHKGAASERIAVTVDFPDGHQETEVFPYLWVYENGERDDPWSKTNLKRDPDGPTPLVFPPAGTDTSSYSPLIKYILDHTRPDGSTVLAECPKAR
jgi:hypothetical protein